MIKACSRFCFGPLCCAVIIGFLVFIHSLLRDRIADVPFALRDEQIESKDGRYQAVPDLMHQPRFEFDPNFKNPCWYKGKHLRCLPYMYIFGVKKCGTTAFFKSLTKHPFFIDPGFREAQWFASKRFENNGTGDINDYVKMFNNVSKTILQDSSIQPNGALYNYKYITGEKSPSNLHINSRWREAYGNKNLQEPKFTNLNYIQHFLPSVKILIIFRNPVDRLYSDYFHEYGTLMPDNEPNIQEFHEVVKNGIHLYKKCFAERSVRSCVYEPHIYEETKIQIQLGIYYIYWQDMLRLFPRKQIFVLKSEHLRDHFNRDMKSVFKFLDIPNLTNEAMIEYGIAKSKTKASKREPMLQKTADMLYEFYAPYNKRMAKLMSDDYFLFKRTKV